MKKYCKVMSFVVAILSFLILGIAPSVRAVPMLTLDDGAGNVVTITDEVAGDLVSGTSGVVGFFGSLGGTSVWTVNLTAGFTKPELGSASTPLMDLLSFNTSTGGGTLTITFSEDFFTGLVPGFIGSIGGNSSSSATTVTYSAFVDNTNTKFSGIQIGTTGPLTATGVGNTFAGAFTGTGPTASPYALTQQIVLTHTSGEVFTSFDASLRPVPEPASLLLLGSGLVGLGLVARRKKANKAQ